MKYLRYLSLACFCTLLLVSCEKEPEPVQKYIDLELMDAWQEFEVGENEEIIMKISIVSETSLDISWKEEPYQKDIDSYTGDIVVSAYRPDGVTPYFEDKDNGFQEEAVIFDLEEGDDQVILIIKAHEGLEGTFGIRARGINAMEVTNPKDLEYNSIDFIEKNINAGDVKWLRVDCGSDTDVTVEWLEWDRPTEETSQHTADIQVSVFSEDLQTIYVNEKNHGYGENARYFTLTHGTSIIYLRVTLYDVNKPGTYAIRAYPTPVIK